MIEINVLVYTSDKSVVGTEPFFQCCRNGLRDFVVIVTAATKSKLLGLFRRWCRAMVCGQCDDVTVPTKLGVEVVEEILKHDVGSKCDVLYFVAIGTEIVTDRVVARERDGQQVCNSTIAEVLSFDCRFR